MAVLNTIADRLSPITHLKNLRSSLKKNDVLVTTAGTIGQIGLVTEEIPPANIDQDIGRIAIHNSEVSPFFCLGIFAKQVWKIST